MASVQTLVTATDRVPFFVYAGCDLPPECRSALAVDGLGAIQAMVHSAGIRGMRMVDHGLRSLHSPGVGRLVACAKVAGSTRTGIPAGRSAKYMHQENL